MCSSFKTTLPPLNQLCALRCKINLCLGYPRQSAPAPSESNSITQADCLCDLWGYFFISLIRLIRAIRD